MVLSMSLHDHWIMRNLPKQQKTGIIHLQLLRRFMFGQIARHPEAVERRSNLYLFRLI